MLTVTSLIITCYVENCTIVLTPIMTRTRDMPTSHSDADSFVQQMQSKFSHQNIAWKLLIAKTCCMYSQEKLKGFAFIRKNIVFDNLIAKFVFISNKNNLVKNVEQVSLRWRSRNTLNNDCCWVLIRLPPVTVLTATSTYTRYNSTTCIARWE